jgi:hypothetical protein
VFCKTVRSPDINILAKLAKIMERPSERLHAGHYYSIFNLALIPFLPFSLSFFLPWGGLTAEDHHAARAFYRGNRECGRQWRQEPIWNRVSKIQMYIAINHSFPSCFSRLFVLTRPSDVKDISGRKQRKTRDFKNVVFRGGGGSKRAYCSSQLDCLKAGCPKFTFFQSPFPSINFFAHAVLAHGILAVRLKCFTHKTQGKMLKF